MSSGRVKVPATEATRDGDAMPRQMVKLILSLSAILAAVAAQAEPIAAPSDHMAFQGPWAYGDRLNVQDGGKTHVAITRSVETDSVWFAFSCSNDPRIFASIFVQYGLAGSAHDDVAVDIELGNVTHLTASAKKVADTVAVFNPDLSRKLFLYAIHEKSLQITFSNSNAGVRTFTFLLQPNNVAFRGIIDACMPQHPGQDL